LPQLATTIVVHIIRDALDTKLSDVAGS